jgi:hypothetical protein
MGLVHASALGGRRQPGIPLARRVARRDEQGSSASDGEGVELVDTAVQLSNF